MSCIEAEHSHHSHSNDRTNEVTGGPIFCILPVVHETRVMRMTLDTRVNGAFRAAHRRVPFFFTVDLDLHNDGQ